MMAYQFMLLRARWFHWLYGPFEWEGPHANA